MSLPVNPRAAFISFLCVLLYGLYVIHDPQPHKDSSTIRNCGVDSAICKFALSSVGSNTNTVLDRDLLKDVAAVCRRALQEERSLPSVGWFSRNRWYTSYIGFKIEELQQKYESNLYRVIYKHGERLIREQHASVVDHPDLTALNEEIHSLITDASSGSKPSLCQKYTQVESQMIKTFARYFIHFVLLPSLRGHRTTHETV